MEQFFMKGADVSIIKEVEAFGGVFYLDGQEKDLFEILSVKGINTIRLRLWVDPYDDDKQPYLGGTNDLQTTIELAKRAKQYGLKFMLDFHYSDFWADPKKQSKPKAWQSLSGKQLEDQVYNYTKETLEVFKDQHIVPEFVQIGNEITNGMLWPEGKTQKYLFEERKFEDMDPQEKKEGYDRLAGLIKAGVRSTRETLPETAGQVILHLDFGGANDLYRGWFDEITAREVDYDIIGLSYYPFWHGTLEDLRSNMEDISARYNKDVLVVETSYGFTGEVPPGGAAIFSAELAEIGGYPPSVEGQAAFLRDLMATVKRVPEGRGLGIVYWEPAWLPVNGTSWASYAGMKYGNDMGEMGNHWSNQAMFDFDGNALDSLNVFKAGPTIEE
ncbi:glycosyl hydrolase 53 family protein [Paenibacillus sp. M1]|uniref:Arabinogalactan endo-beta-1,4-galactanase n=1 Tax=Paenibacillus haidiansis TaxID=1574488 RepID=A0ABU7VP57_9BACL